MKLLPPTLLVRAYMQGIFPMAMDTGEIGWFSPDPRAVIPLESFHVPHGLRRLMRKNPYEIRVDSAFRQVMHGCAGRKETWIDPVIQDSYAALHDSGCAHSVETWENGELVGGLYGVALGGAFFGESMFSRRPSASGVALVHLVERLLARGYILLDTQWSTPHLRRFGVVEITRPLYLDRLAAALRLDCAFNGPPRIQRADLETKNSAAD
ncbi:MAG TPA: leucyl/phenylalanyl-tRNA--protein transferase [Verrucomicrobiales bacterium]|nr:leucyl/phenylalanyl-tRNA--protein transferase [Verrucomicrobiales bacterium]